MITVQLDGDRQLIAKLMAMPGAVQQSLVRKITALAIQLERHVKVDKLNGPRTATSLEAHTHNLQRSIFEEVISTPTSVTGKVASSGDVKYAAIQEYGGVINRHGKKAGDYQIRIPARPYMASALQDMKGQILEGMQEAVIKGLRL